MTARARRRRPPARPLEVLLVEDSDSIRAEIYEALTLRGLKVRVAENGLVAVSRGPQGEPDVILTDVEMPVMDGWTLLRMARSRKKLANRPIVFTSLSDELSRLQGYRMGVDDYLAKRTPPDDHQRAARRGQPPRPAGALGPRGERAARRLAARRPGERAVVPRGGEEDRRPQPRA
ncbi:MAG: response regulator [Nannocystis sp.]|nr:response regulator [Nannocystis sp.]